MRGRGVWVVHPPVWVYVPPFRPLSLVFSFAVRFFADRRVYIGYARALSSGLTFPVSGLHPAAFFASRSTSSFPGIPLGEGVHCMVTLMPFLRVASISCITL